ncbi:transporter [Legionella sainthelensi]|uniref:transporter n=1 Tax=Legionella sainthelensi TaxID=28087 RepID=UPI00135944F7|nr:transporter [Legionella sainthelensi]
MFFYSAFSSAIEESNQKIPYPCAEGTILTYFKRPTVATSACPVPYGRVTLEGGIQYNDFINRGEQWVWPQSKIRIGLPWRSELSILFPSEKANPNLNLSGHSATQLALKHELIYTKHWNIATRAVYIPASGDVHYGTAKDGYWLNGILAFRHKSVNMTAMIGFSRFSTSKEDGGAGFNSFSPDVLVGWFAQNWLEFYAEVYGQTRTGPNRGPGYNLDAGVIFLINKSIAFDVGIGKRLAGTLGNFNTYYDSGISFMF